MVVEVRWCGVISCGVEGLVVVMMVLKVVVMMRLNLCYCVCSFV